MGEESQTIPCVAVVAAIALVASIPFGCGAAINLGTAEPQPDYSPLTWEAHGNRDDAARRLAVVVSHDVDGAYDARRARQGRAQWATYARTVRGTALIEREKEYIEAARMLHLPGWRILFRHLLPNCLAPVIVIATMQIARAIGLEATLSFLGLVHL